MIETWTSNLLGFFARGNGVGSVDKKVNKVVLSTGVSGSYDADSRTLTLTAAGGVGSTGIELCDEFGAPVSTGVTKILLQGVGPTTAITAEASVPGQAIIRVSPTLSMDGGGEPIQFPTHLSFGAGFQSSYVFNVGDGSKTWSVSATAASSIHDPVDCVLLENTAIEGVGHALPTAEQADGVTVNTMGQRVLSPTGMTAPDGSVRYLWFCIGTLLVPLSAEVVSEGHSVFVRPGGRVYGKKVMRHCRPAEAGNDGYPVWLADGGPTYAARKLISASGLQGWVTLLSWAGPDDVTDAQSFEVYALRRNATTQAVRAWRISGTYRGRDWSVGVTPSISITGSAPTFVEGGETETDARLRVTQENNTISIQCLRDAAGGTNYRYRVEVTVRPVNLG